MTWSSKYGKIYFALLLHITPSMQVVTTVFATVRMGPSCRRSSYLPLVPSASLGLGCSLRMRGGMQRFLHRL